MASARPKKPSAWSPFKYPAFALLWTATLVSNIGTWMHDVGAGWLMTTLSPSPAIVALVQAATTAPVFLFALLAGALADRLDKKRLLIWVNLAMLLVTAGMTAMVAFDQMTPVLVVTFTFLLGTGAALIAPAWQAVVPSLVGQDTLQPAVALNSIGINIARAIGPALAGALIVSAGLYAPFAVNMLTFCVILLALMLWTPARQPASALAPEPLADAIFTGVRHALNNAALKAVLKRALGFFLWASAFWALLPIAAKAVEDQMFGSGAALYGILLGTTGSAAVVGALILPRLRHYLAAETLVTLGAIGMAFALVLLAIFPVSLAVLAGALLAGVSWIAVLTSLNVSAQTALPNWVRARGLSVFLMVFFGAMTVGSTLWGQVAENVGLRAAFGVAALGLLVSAFALRGVKLGRAGARDLSPAMAWPEPTVALASDDLNDRGPVLVSVRYDIKAGSEADFLAALSALAGERRRDGASEWNVYQDAATPTSWVEVFKLPSWAEHLRQHERATVSDAALRSAVHAFHVGPQAPKVDHLLAPSAAPGRPPKLSDTDA
ncbi:MAG: MFS transporter [Pseudomonadota bacterium]